MKVPEFSKSIPGLGDVKLVSLSGLSYETAVRQAQVAEESHRASAFANSLFQSLLVDPQLKARAALFNGATLEALELITAAQIGFEFMLNAPYAEFVATHSNLSPRQRLYNAHIEIEERSRAQLDEIRRRMQEFEEATPAIRDALKAAGFWVPLSAPMRLNIELEHLVNEKEATPENVRSLILEHFRREDYGALTSMVKRWYSFSYYAKRKKIIGDALEAHTRGLFTLTIPTLLPLAEGFWRSRLGVPRYAGIGRWMASEMERVTEGSSGVLKLDLGALTPFVKDGVYLDIPQANQTPEKYYAWVQNRGITSTNRLHRHAILHGLQSDYASEENSLRAFFLLDSLFHLFSE